MILHRRLGLETTERKLRTEGLRGRVRLRHAGLVRPEEQAVHVGELNRVVVCRTQATSFWMPWIRQLHEPGSTYGAATHSTVNTAQLACVCVHNRVYALQYGIAMPRMSARERAPYMSSLPMPQRVSISAATLPTPPIPTTATCSGLESASA